MIYIMIKYKMQGQSCSLKHYDIHVFDSLFSKKKKMVTICCYKISLSSETTRNYDT